MYPSSLKNDKINNCSLLMQIKKCNLSHNFGNPTVPSPIICPFFTTEGTNSRNFVILSLLYFLSRFGNVVWCCGMPPKSNFEDKGVHSACCQDYQLMTGHICVPFQEVLGQLREKKTPQKTKTITLCHKIACIGRGHESVYGTGY